MDGCTGPVQENFKLNLEEAIFNAVTVTQFWVELAKDCVIQTLTHLCDEDFLDCICQAAVTFILDLKKLMLENHKPQS